MGMLQEFKAFAMRGNVMDMAVGVVIGAAFGKIVSALVDQIIMPLVGWMTSGQNFAELAFVAGQKPGPDGTLVPAVAIGYGAFVQSILDFMIVAFVIFLVIKLMNRLKKQEAAAPVTAAEASAEVQLLIEIRDALKAR
ncbi:MAG: large conductance mechanosensitive channel protein MscL [Lysobacterales bacterium CG02_land_8_20_14_3_00_62_12]|jgi:large conductance mechanosensitive channel|nr:MAG: large conductance mechanosensitive channel protein MscL [Xanthomonadales bacterium CG02_land_8_20_14_3_00_62_12]PJA39779.1 MAG: large conductance mechanosensitive channel protein MscL [Xanthomonadales bacterium CG_4_9_14_3_um_filter_62_6]